MTARLRFATFLAPSFRPLYEFVAEQCDASELVCGDDWRELRDGSIDVAFVCSPPLVWLKGAVEALAAPVLTDSRFHERPLYSSDVVVRADSPFRSLADLRGRRWAYNEPSSWSGYWVTLFQVGDWSYFSDVVCAGFHQRALRMVADGLVDGSAIDCAVLSRELRVHPELGDLIRVIDSLGPAPIQPVVVRARLDRHVKQCLKRRLLALRGPVLEEFEVARFDEPPDYSLVAACLERATAHV